MKICEKKSNTGRSFYVTLPEDQVKMADLKKGDSVSVQTNAKKEIVIKKIKGE